MTATPVFTGTEKVGVPEMSLLVSAIRERAQHFQAVIGAAAVVMTPYPTWTPVAGTPIRFSVTACTVFIGGAWLSVPATTFTLANGDASYHRYDSLVIQLQGVTTSDSAGNQLQTDTAVPLTNAGVPASPPLLPGLGANEVQLGWVDVPPGATTAAQCTLATTPTQLSNTLIDLQNHIGASLLLGVVHGVQAAAPGAPTPNQLLLGGPRGGTGALEPLASLFAGMMASASQDGGLRVTANGNTGSATADGTYLEAFGASGAGAVNVRNVLRLAGPNAVALALLQLIASQVEVTGNLAVDGTLTVGGNSVLTGGGTVQNANQLGGHDPSYYATGAAQQATADALTTETSARTAADNTLSSEIATLQAQLGPSLKIVQGEYDFTYQVNIYNNQFTHVLAFGTTFSQEPGVYIEVYSWNLRGNPAYVTSSAPCSVINGTITTSQCQLYLGGDEGRGDSYRLRWFAIGPM